MIVVRPAGTGFFLPIVASSRVARPCIETHQRAGYSDSSAPTGVNVTKVPHSCIFSQPRSIASLRPAPYSAGLLRSRNRNGSLIFSMCVRPYRLDGVGDFEDAARGLLWIGKEARGSVFHQVPILAGA